MSARLTRADRAAASSWFIDRTAEGVPTVVTSHEAWRLSHGLVGREGDHGDPWPLMAVAVAVVRART